MTISESSSRLVAPRLVSGANLPPAIKRPFARVLHVTIAVVAVASALLGGWWFDTETFIWTIGGRWLVKELIPSVVTFSVAGVFLLQFREAALIGRTMLAGAVASGLSVLSAGLFFKSFEYGWTSIGEFFALSIMLGNLGFIIAFWVLPQLFPNGLLRGWLWRVMFVVSVALMVLREVLLAVSNRRPTDDAEFWDITFLNGPFEVSYYTSVLIVLLSLVVRLRRSAGVARRQVALFTAGWVIGIGASEIVARQSEGRSDALLYLYGSWAPMLVAIVAVAVVRYGLFDIRLIVRRAAVYGVMVLALTVLFAGVYALVLYLVASQVVGEQYRWIAVMVALAVVLAADPFRRRLRSRLEERLLGTRSDPMRALGRLDDEVLTGPGDEQAVYVRMARIVADAVRSPQVSVAIHRGTDIDVVASSSETDLEPADPLVVRIVHRGERLGEFRVAGRTPGETYGRIDRALLERLASQAGALVYGLRRDLDIDALRQDAIEAMAEQRMSLGRDLHDGIAPLLAGAGLSADALRRGMPEGSPDAVEAARLATHLRTAATEVRRIAHDLQPTAGDSGLGGLVRDYVGGLSGPTVPQFLVEVDGLDGVTLPATVELAMSRVALEAVNNVVRHARAANAGVRVAVTDGVLELAVTDDGVGLAQPYVSGLGITSMRSRVEALGGTFELGAVDPRGTRLVAHVPVPA